jgi:hypothetical protein
MADGGTEILGDGALGTGYFHASSRISRKAWMCGDTADFRGALLRYRIRGEDARFL